MKKISIVIPVYNVEKYLRRCLDSVLNQTLADIEVIAVNDGSTDMSQEILEEYQEKYGGKLKVYQKENGGMSDARNYGIMYATGEYVGFIDSDDYIEPQMYEEMYDKAKTKDYDIVCCDFCEVRGEDKRPYTSGIVQSGCGEKFIKESMMSIYSAPWNKIYKRELINTNLFKLNVWYEDVEFLYRLLPQVQSIGVVHESYYNYIIRKGSVSNRAHTKIYDQIDNWNGLIDYYKEKEIYDCYKDELEYCYIRYIRALFIKSASKFDKKEFKKAIIIAEKNIKRQFPDYKKNIYLQQKTVRNFYLRNFNSIFAKLIYIRYFRERK